MKVVQGSKRPGKLDLFVAVSWWLWKVRPSCRGPVGRLDRLLLAWCQAHGWQVKFGQPGTDLGDASDHFDAGGGGYPEHDVLGRESVDGVHGVAEQLSPGGVDTGRLGGLVQSCVKAVAFAAAEVRHAVEPNRRVVLRRVRVHR